MFEICFKMPEGECGEGEVCERGYKLNKSSRIVCWGGWWVYKLNDLPLRMYLETLLIQNKVKGSCQF